MGLRRMWIALLATGFALTPFVLAQTAAADTSEPAAQPSQPAIPPEQQATRQQVTRLLEAMGVRQQSLQLSQALQISLRQKLRDAAGNDNGKLPLAQRLAIAKLLNDYSTKAANVYPVDEMLADLAAIYQRYLDREDVEATTAFYTSRTGQNLLRAEPAIATDTLPMVRQRIEQKGDQLAAELKKDIAAVRESSPPVEGQSGKK